MMNFLMDEEGQGMVEYGLILALIAVVVLVALTTLGEKVGEIFDTSSNALVNATGGAGGSGSGEGTGG